jgi:hypothetical protein
VRAAIELDREHATVLGLAGSVTAQEADASYMGASSSPVTMTID